MNTNLLTLVSNYLTPDVLDRIAFALGVETSALRKANSAAIPTLLASLADVSSKADGARKLANAVNEQTPGVIGALTSSISDSGRQGIIDAGMRGLTSLLGRNSISALSSAIARFAGLGESSSSSLLGILGPALLGMLGKQMSEHGLDASGLARLLGSQKQSFQAAMPSGFGDLLQSTGFPITMDAPMQKEAPGAWATPPASRKPDQSQQASWLLWLLPLIAVGAIAWWFFGNRTNGRPDHVTTAIDKPIDRTANNAETTTQTAATLQGPNLTGGADITSITNKTLVGVASTLQGITDDASARSALPKLDAATSEFEKIAQLAAQLPQEGKSALAALVTAARPALESAFDKVLAIPGVDSVARPAIETLRGKLTTLSTA